MLVTRLDRLLVARRMVAQMDEHLRPKPLHLRIAASRQSTEHGASQNVVLPALQTWAGSNRPCLQRNLDHRFNCSCVHLNARSQLVQGRGLCKRSVVRRHTRTTINCHQERRALRRSCSAMLASVFTLLKCLPSVGV